MTKIIANKDINSEPINNKIFTKDKIYEMHYVDNRYAKIHNYIGYTYDDEKLKRWLTEEFKEKYFEESYLL